MSYPLANIYQEVAFIAYYFHWPCDHILEMEHQQRRLWVEQIGSINRTINEMEEEHVT